MRAHSVGHVLALCAAALLLGSCEVARQAPFHEAEFAWTRGKGTGAVAGKAFIEMRDKSVNVGSRAHIVLYPVNDYTTESVSYTHLTLPTNREV